MSEEAIPFHGGSSKFSVRAAGRGVLIQLQVVYALILRETRTRFGKSYLGYLWALIEPLLWIGTMVGLHTLYGSTGRPGMTMIGFFGTGFIAFDLFRDCQSRIMVAVSSNMPLLFYQQVQPLDMMIARVLLECATGFCVFSIILGGEALYLGELHVDDPLMVMVGMFLAAGLGGSLGAVLASLSVFSDSVGRLSGVLLRPLMFASGTFFALEDVPQAVAEYMVWNPVLHVVELVRDAWHPGYTSTRINIWYPVAWTIVLSFLAVTLERVVRPRLHAA